MSEHMLPLSEVVQALRAEIVEASKAGSDEAVKFQIGVIEVELTVAAKRDGGIDGKIKFQVLGVGAELGATGKLSSEQIHKIKLQLSAAEVLPDGTRGHLEIGRRPHREKQGGRSE